MNFISITREQLQQRQNDPELRFRLALNRFLVGEAYKASYGTCWGNIANISELNTLIGIRHYSDERITGASPELDKFRFGETLEEGWQEELAIFLRELLIRLGFMVEGSSLDDDFFPYISGTLTKLSKYEKDYKPYQSKKAASSTNDDSSDTKAKEQAAEEAAENFGSLFN